jgi:hypothetical protein
MVFIGNYISQIEWKTNSIHNLKPDLQQQLGFFMRLFFDDGIIVKAGRKQWNERNWI